LHRQTYESGQPRSGDRQRASFSLGQPTSGSLIATQLATTVLITVLMLAFVMHISAGVLTRSAMPGLATSILPGLPGVVMLLTYVWTR
jgi:hypothetical protein